MQQKNTSGLAKKLHLPLLILIFSYLELADFLRISLVSKEFKELLVNGAFGDKPFALNLIRKWLEFYFGEGIFPPERTIERAVRELADAEDLNLFNLYKATHIVGLKKNNLYHLAYTTLAEGPWLYEKQILKIMFHALASDAYSIGESNLRTAFQLAEFMYDENKNIFTAYNLLRHLARFILECSQYSSWFFEEDCEGDNYYAKIINIFKTAHIKLKLSDLQTEFNARKKLVLSPTFKNFNVPTKDNLKSAFNKLKYLLKGYQDNLEFHRELQLESSASNFIALQQQTTVSIQSLNPHKLTLSFFKEALSEEKEFLEEFEKLEEKYQKQFVQHFIKLRGHTILRNCLSYGLWQSILIPDSKFFFTSDLFQILFEPKLYWLFNIYKSDLFKEITALFEHLNTVLKHFEFTSVIKIFDNPILESYAHKTKKSLIDVWKIALELLFPEIDVQPFIENKVIYVLLCTIAPTKKLPHGFKNLVASTSLVFALTLISGGVVKNAEDMDVILSLYDNYPRFKRYLTIPIVELLLSFDDNTKQELVNFINVDMEISSDIFQFICKLQSNENSLSSKEVSILEKFTLNELSVLYENKITRKALLNNNVSQQFWLKVLNTRQILSLTKQQFNVLGKCWNDDETQTRYLNAWFPAAQQQPQSFTILSAEFFVNEAPVPSLLKKIEEPSLSLFKSSLFSPMTKPQDDREKLIEAIKQKRRNITRLKILENGGFFKRKRAEANTNHSSKKQKPDSDKDYADVIDLT